MLDGVEVATSTLTKAYTKVPACGHFIQCCAYPIYIASAEWLWGNCLHDKQYHQHALHVNDVLCVAETYMHLQLVLVFNAIECMTVVVWYRAMNVIMIYNVSAMFRVH